MGKEMPENRVDADGFLRGATTDGMYLTKYPTTVQCPKCDQNVQTKVRKIESQTAKDLACACCFTGMFCCVCIPCYENATEDTEHQCPNCHHIVGTTCSDDIVAP